VVVPRSLLTAWGAGTLVPLELPLYGATSAPAEARVVCRLTADWERGGTAGLPRAADGRALFRPTEQWVELPRDPDGDLATGQGARFVITGGRTRLLAERLGVCRAFGRVP
jgi:hypothetical protein